MSDDPIAQAFQQIREEAKKRGGPKKLPPLGQRIASPQQKSSTPRRVGRPTGPDGRALPAPSRLSSLGDVLNVEFHKRGWDRDLAQGWVHAHWEELVGENIAAHTHIEMIKDTTVFISCDSTAWATNLRMMQRQILSTIAKKVGPNIVKELKIFGPRPPSWRKGPLHVKGRGPRDTYG